MQNSLYCEMPNSPDTLHVLLIGFASVVLMVPLAGAVEYTDYFSAVGYNSPNECLEYDTKQSDGQISVILELWGMRSTSSLPFLWNGSTQ